MRCNFDVNREVSSSFSLFSSVDRSEQLCQKPINLTTYLTTYPHRHPDLQAPFKMSYRIGEFSHFRFWHMFVFASHPSTSKQYSKQKKAPTNPPQKSLSKVVPDARTRLARRRVSRSRRASSASGHGLRWSTARAFGGSIGELFVPVSGIR